MKYARYVIMAGFILLLFSFNPIGKRRSPTLPPKDGVGHIQWIHSVYYYAILDSATGSILKGAVISDMDHDKLREGGPILRRHDAIEPPIETFTYDEYGDQIEDDKYHTDGTLFNKITRKYSPNGDLKEVVDSNNIRPERIWKYFYKYDNAGNLLDSMECYANGGIPQSSRKISRYDSSGRLREELYFHNDTITPTELTIFRYNNKKQLVETDASNIENGNRNTLTPNEKNDFWYDTKGRLYDKATYRYHEGLVKNTKITFDSAGEITDTYSYAGDKMLTGSTENRIFKATNTIQEDVYDADGLLTDYTISHDSARHLMDKGVFRINYQRYMGADQKYHNKGPGDTVMMRHLVNDNHFNVIVNDNFFDDGKVMSQKSYQYTYDSIGNWIEKVEFDKDNKPVKIIEREIGYFKN